MTDATNKSKSHQVTVLENMVNKLENILELFRRSRRYSTPSLTGTRLPMTSRTRLSPEKGKFQEGLVWQEEATGIIAGMPALV